MMDRSPKPPQALMQAIADDLRPVKPSPQPVQLALRMVPLALLVSSVVLLAIGPRHDSGLLGPLLAWGASAAQFALAIVLVWIAAHESTPAARLPRQTVYFAAAAASLVVVFVTLLTFSTSPAGAPLVVNEMLRVAPWIMGFACGTGSTVAGGILVLIFSWVFRNSLATRPTVAGALYGAGAGLAINAGWRIACPVSTPWHALGAHGVSDHRRSGPGSTHRALFRKSQIAHRRQTCLSASASLTLTPETLSVWFANLIVRVRRLFEYHSSTADERSCERENPRHQTEHCPKCLREPRESSKMQL